MVRIEVDTGKLRGSEGELLMEVKKGDGKGC